MRDQFVFLPPELCLLDGVPDQIRNSPGMRDCLAMTRTRPDQKLNEIEKMVQTLMKQKTFKDWEIDLEKTPSLVKSFILEAPQIFKQNQVIHIDENVLRKLPI